LKSRSDVLVSEQHSLLRVAGSSERDCRSHDDALNRRPWLGTHPVPVRLITPPRTRSFATLLCPGHGQSTGRLANGSTLSLIQGRPVEPGPLRATPRARRRDQVVSGADWRPGLPHDLFPVGPPPGGGLARIFAEFDPTCAHFVPVGCTQGPRQTGRVRAYDRGSIP
jgi:hypothetical protein